MDPHKEVYREEAFELLADLEDALLELERAPHNRELIGRVFRNMHTIKGSGAMFGFDDIAAFTHTIETVYDHIREGALEVTAELISLTLRACDRIKTMLGASPDGAPADAAPSVELEQAFRRYIPTPDQTPTPAASSAEAAPDDEADHLHTYRIQFRPSQDLFQNGTNPIPLLNELRSLGPCSIVAHLQGLPDLAELNPEACYTTWDIILSTGCSELDIRDVFIFVEHLSQITITPIESQDDTGAEYKRLGEILVERGEIGAQELDEALRNQKRLGEVLIEGGKATPAEVQAALVEQTHVREVRKQRQAAEETASIRVPAPKLDALVNMVGELVTIQAQLTQYAALKNEQDLIGIAEEVERLSANLRDVTMGIRMLPIGTTFAKFKRLVRDLSAELGKEIAFITEGAETELDKTVIERLGDPLVHLIRNSIDHGIEPPAVRVAQGKPAQGTLRLSAEHSGAYVLISISDDGAGLNTDAIRAKALEKGLITAEAPLSEQEINDLIWAPGFSTAKNVTGISGRGVGTDVVKSNIDALRGTIEVQSVRGQGTTFTLKLPLTLAIIDGLLVSIAQDGFVIPLSTVLECVDLTAADREHAHGRHLIRVRDEAVPYIHLRELFAYPGPPPEVEQIVITEMGEKKVGFVVDKVIGQHQTVIKNLGQVFREIECISGATIRGDGTIALILDIHKLYQHTQQADLSAYAGL